MRGTLSAKILKSYVTGILPSQRRVPSRPKPVIFRAAVDLLRLLVASKAYLLSSAMVSLNALLSVSLRRLTFSALVSTPEPIFLSD